MTMHKALHPKSDVDRLYLPRKEGGRGLISVEDTVIYAIAGLEDRPPKIARPIGSMRVSGAQSLFRGPKFRARYPSLEKEWSIVIERPL